MRRGGEAAALAASGPPGLQAAARRSAASMARVRRGTSLTLWILMIWKD
jgi:hypothetical protein